MSLFIHQPGNTSQKVIYLAFVGVALESYDFMVFAFFATVMSQLFFPQIAPTAALLSTFAVYAVGYLARPLGGFIFGHYGDRLGRKRLFLFSLILMAVPCFLIGLLPTYATLGIYASILLVLMRVLQGISYGGDIPNASAYLIEIVDPKRRGFAFALGTVSTIVGMILAAFAGTLLTSLLTPQQLTAWGWRIPFLFGGVVGGVSYFMRRGLAESPHFLGLKQTETAPLKEVIVKYPGTVIKGMATTMANAAASGVFFAFLPTYLATYAHIPLKIAFGMNLVAMIAFALQTLAMGTLSDRIGRQKVTALGITLLLVFSYPLFVVFQQGHLLSIGLAYVAAMMIVGTIAGGYALHMLESFPTAMRCSGYAISYNMAMAIFGGLAPVIATALIGLTANTLSPSYLLMASALIGLLATLSMKETLGKQL